MAVFLGSIAMWSQSDAKLTRDEAKKLRNPVPYSKKSLTQGRVAFGRACATCHGLDGKAHVDVIADATDLTSPKLYKSGTSDGEIFRSIRDGAGANLVMPSFRSQYSKDDDIWNLVNYIRSLGPEDQRPALQPDDKDESKKK